MAVPIAYVTARFPPMQTSGTYRVEAVLRHLPAHGFEIHPVTIPDRWIAQQSGRELPAVDRAGVLQPEAPTDALIRAAAEIPMIRKVMRSMLVPDILSLWAKSVPSSLRERLEDVRLVYATSPPFSTMVLADRLASQLQVPCVQEIRDPPSFNRRLRGRSTSWKRRMLSFEARYLPKADAVITVTEGTRSRLLDLHDELDAERCFVVTNGYPDTDVDISLANRDPNLFTITYVGSFQGGTTGREDSIFNPAVVLPAMRQLGADRLQLRIVGPVTGTQRRHIEEGAGPVPVVFVGVVERARAVAELAAADVSLILAEDDEWWIGRKVFESLAFSSRVLAIVPAQGDTARLLSGYEKASVVGLDELDHLDTVLAGLYSDWSSGMEGGRVDEVKTVQSDRSCVAQIAEVLDSVLDRTTGRA